jgi:lipoprotein signal peptidase
MALHLTSNTGAPWALFPNAATVVVVTGACESSVLTFFVLSAGGASSKKMRAWVLMLALLVLEKAPSLARTV